MELAERDRADIDLGPQFPTAEGVTGRLRLDSGMARADFIGTAAVLVHSKLREGAASEAGSLALGTLRRINHGGLTATEREGVQWLVIGAGAAALALGRLAEAIPLFERVIGAADQFQSLARGYVACVLALQGKVTAASRESQLALETHDPSRLSADATAAALVAQGLCALSRLESDDLFGITTRLAPLAISDPILSTLRQCLVAEALRLRNRAQEAIHALQHPAAEGGGLATNAKRIIRSRVLLSAGRPGAALRELQTSFTDDAHHLCRPAHLACALVAMGMSAQALTVTEGCLELGDKHSAGTLRDVSLLRAAAFLELDRRESAASVLRWQWAQVDDAGLVGASLLVPRLINELAALATECEIGGAAALSRAASLSPSLALDASYERLRRLSDRERGVLVELNSPDPLGKIAARLFIAVNTLKVHTRNLYAKLGVSSREQAVAVATAAGFFDFDPNFPVDLARGVR